MSEEKLKEYVKVSDDELKTILRLPMNQKGTKMLNSIIEKVPNEFNFDEKLFVILNTNPQSKLFNKPSKIARLLEKDKHSRGYVHWFLNCERYKKYISKLRSKETLDDIKKALEDDVRRNIAILNMDRASYKKDMEYTNEETGQTFELIADKKLSELTDEQKDCIADYTYDKNGRAHPIIEKRAEARQALANYIKIYGQDEEVENKQTETVVTLEGIRDKATAKISIIQKNNNDAEKAGVFYQKMENIDEEA